MKKPSQTSRGVPVGLKVGFKPHKEYSHVPKEPTSSSGNKKKRVEPTNEVTNSNPFEVLNSVDNDVELGTNGGTTNFANNGANSSGSSFMNVENSSTSATPIIDKIKKFEDLLMDGQTILVDEAGNPLKKIEYPGDYDSEDEVASADNYMARSMALEREKTTEMILYVDLKCRCCYKKVKKLLCKLPQVRDQVFDVDKNKVTIAVVCCDPEKLRDKLCCKGGGTIQSIEIKPPPKTEKPPEQQTSGPVKCKQYPTCCQECNEGCDGGPCHYGRLVLPPPCYYYYGYLYPSNRPCYVSRCDYFCEDNPQGCSIM
nr:protein pyricularia oryzae resistance 21-like [Tanacetum cinerariifolium]